MSPEEPERDPRSPCCAAGVNTLYDRTEVWRVVGPPEAPADPEGAWSVDEEHDHDTGADFKRYECDACEGPLVIDPRKASFVEWDHEDYPIDGVWPEKGTPGA